MAIRFVYTGENRRDIPDNITHVSVHESITYIPGGTFADHPNIIELVCHDGVLCLGFAAFYSCPRLTRVIIPGVELIESSAFQFCSKLKRVKCGKLVFVGNKAFGICKSLKSIKLPCAMLVGNLAFKDCSGLTKITFGAYLESIRCGAFTNCNSLERIKIPLRSGIITHDNTFASCPELKHVDLIESDVAALIKTTRALHFKKWRRVIKRKFDSINQILPNVRSGNDDEAKAQTIRKWIACILSKIADYKSRHIVVMNEVATILDTVLPRDVVSYAVLPYLEFPLHTFERESLVKGKKQQLQQVQELVRSHVLPWRVARLLILM